MAGTSRRLVQFVVRAEDAVQAVVVVVLRTVGRRRPLIIPFVGHGTPALVRIRARVVLGRPAAAARTVPGPPAAEAAGAAPAVGAAQATGAAPSRRRRLGVLRASLSRFLTAELPRVPVTVHAPGGSATVLTDREGYVDAVVDVPGIDPGWHEVELSFGEAATASTKLLVVDPRARIGLVSDVDDTILETGLTRGLAFLRTTLLTEVGDRAPLPGAAALYQALVAPREPGGASSPVFYVSTSPWNLHEMLLQFVALRGFPLGPLLLTDWGPWRGGLFRVSSQEHKLTLIRGLLIEHPLLRLVLVGDGGQADPEIYATVAQESPDRIDAVYIRRTPSAEPRRLAELDDLAARVTACGVPMLAVDGSTEIAAHAASLGLLDDAAVDAVRADELSGRQEPAR
jgi:phosphatidate phosphatase APP1